MNKTMIYVLSLLVIVSSFVYSSSLPGRERNQPESGLLTRTILTQPSAGDVAQVDEDDSDLWDVSNTTRLSSRDSSGMYTEGGMVHSFESDHDFKIRLEKQFMDRVAKEAQNWLNKLPNKTGIIRLEDVERVVREGKTIGITTEYYNYSPFELLYIQGFLQVMAQ